MMLFVIGLFHLDVKWKFFVMFLYCLQNLLLLFLDLHTVLV